MRMSPVIEIRRSAGGRRWTGASCERIETSFVVRGPSLPADDVVCGASFVCVCAWVMINNNDDHEDDRVEEEQEGFESRALRMI